MIIVMRWRAIIAIMIVGMTTTMTMIMLSIKPQQGYQRGTRSISTKSMAMLILKGLQFLKPNKLR